MDLDQFQSDEAKSKIRLNSDLIEIFCNPEYYCQISIIVKQRGFLKVLTYAKKRMQCEKINQIRNKWK